MALYNRVKVAITAGGAGNLTVGAAVAMFRDFTGAAVPTGTVVSYVIEDAASNAWEYGRGTYTAPNTFARTTVLATSAGTTTPINAGADTILFIDALAEDFVASLAVGTTPITGGTSGRVVFNNGGNFGEAANLTYDGTDTTVRGLKLNGATSGAVSIKPQAVAGAWTLTLPTTAGTAGQILSTDGAGLATWANTSSALKGSINPVADAAPATPVKGDYYFTTAAGTAGASWTGANGKTLNIGDMIIWDGTNWLVIPSTTRPAGADKQIQFNDAGAFAGATNIVWDKATNVFSVNGTAAVKFPAGNGTTERPAAPVVGMVRYNSTLNSFEGYSGSTAAWSSLIGSFTDTRIPFGNTSKYLTEDAEFTYNATTNNMRVGGINIGSDGAALTTVTGKVTAAATGLTVEAVGALPVDVTTNGVKRATFNEGTNPFNVQTTTSEDAFVVDYRDNVVCGSGRITSGANRQNDMLFIPTTDAVPTGVPPTYLGRVPIVFCTADKKLYTYVTTATGWEAVI